jgi:hypothetical protein
MCHLLHARAAGWCQRGVASIGEGARTVIERGIGWLVVVIGGRRSSSAVVATTFFVVLVPFLGRLIFAASHSHVATDTDTAALLGHLAAQGSALGQSREFLSGENGEWRRLDLSTVGDEVVAIVDDVRVTRIQILDLCQILEQCKAQAVLALVAN